MKVTSPSVIRQLMKSYNISFRKSLGQNFLIDENILRIISDTVPIGSKVLEVGPGLGCLTSAMSKKSNKVCAVEIDRSLCEILGHIFSESNNVKILNNDILEVDIDLLKREFDIKDSSDDIVVVGNLPYYIVTPVIFKFLELDLNLKLMTFLVQREVAERIVSTPGNKSYGILSVAIQYYGVPRIVKKNVSKNCFLPVPKVNSTIICIEPHKKYKIGLKNEYIFFEIVKGCFSHRRKTILNSMSKYFENKKRGIDKESLMKVLNNVGIDVEFRAENLSIEQFVLISNQVCDTCLFN